MKKAFKVIWTIIQIVIIIYVILIVSYMSISNRYGFSETNNYVLNVDNDQLFAIKKTKKFSVGEKVYYYSVRNEKYKIFSSKVLEKGKSYIFSNGDKIPASKLIGKKSTKVPVVGFVLDRLKNSFYFLIFVSAPLLLVFGYRTYKFIKGIIKNKRMGL